jgi:hypothetical protein
VRGDPLGHGLPELEPVGEYIVPPLGAIRRNFQALHFDFGLPILAEKPVDVVRYTALRVDASQPGPKAVTRIVSLGPLLGQRSWPIREVVAKRLHRAADPEKPVEGILGRIIEIIDEGSSLPPTGTPGFLCGMEFSSYEEEDSYFRTHGMELADAEHRIVLRSEELLLIDNLRVAHGRLGRRRPNELHQLFVGYRSLGQLGQQALLERIFASFNAVRLETGQAP